jgi:hypothetical protein
MTIKDRREWRPTKLSKGDKLVDRLGRFESRFHKDGKSQTHAQIPRASPRPRE